ncbi:hypothetical protein HW555_010955 [Spodoptera exigua]|uniref:Protein NATD1 n=1 Tax=Spodoptera exigua TaxID=7107 RepID=A0A835G9G1_SPOEX|nr:hypothetical protein HW555_010955 [Spodoptera exigua]
MLTRLGARCFSTEALKVVNNVSKQQFQVTMGDSDAVLKYDKQGKHITFCHTEVPPVFQGKGVGSKLAKYAFEYALENSLKVTCQCHFLANYYKNHQDAYKNINIKFDLEDVVNKEKCFGNAKKLAEKASKQYGDAAEFLFYSGLASILEGQVQKGISEQTPLQSEKDLQLAVVIALIYGYKLSSPTEREALYSLESKLKEEKKQAGTLSFYYAVQVVPLVEKMKNEFALQKWDAVYDTMERIFPLDPENIEALKIKIFIALCKNADYIEAADQLNKFFAVLENEEPHNAYQFYYTTQIFSRACGRSSAVLSQVYRFAQYASEMYPGNVDYLSEVGYQCILQGKYKDALSFFKAASKLDSNSITALCGLTLCQMNEHGPTEQIAQQIELLFEMQGSTKLPVLYHLSAQLNLKNSSSAISFLNNAYETKIAYANRNPFSLAYVKDLDPDFLLEVYKEYKKHLPKKPFIIVGYLMYSQEVKNPVVTHCLKLLDAICVACPGLITALYELAKLKFLFGYASDAMKLAQQVNELDSTHAGSQVLLAQILIQQQAYTKAAQSLEMCLSYNFKVRDSAMYHLLNGVILKSAGQLKESLSSFLTSLQIATNKNVVGNVNRAYESDLNIIDKATLYLQIIEIQTELEQFAEAGKTMQEAIQEFSYTSEESRLLIARADLALKKGDVDSAIDLLNEIKPGQPYYFQAHSKMAHIYLKEKNDRAMFTSCFKEIVSNHPMADARTMMGDAYMSIHDPTQAAEAYEAALKSNPKDVQLVKKLGVALVKMHEYDKACQHYESAIRLLNDEDLQFEYYDLLIKLKQYDKVESSISSELNQMYNRDKDINQLKRRVLQAKGRELKNPTSANVNLLLAEAKDIQSNLVKRIEIDSRGDVQEEKQQLSSILCALAKVKSLKEPAVAANLYSEALVHVPRDPNTLLALAKLYANINNSEKCEQTCAVLLNTDPNNESAAVMMADLAFRKVDLEAAQRHLNQILSVKPMSWEALAQLIEVQWRRGRLSDAEQALETAKSALGEQEDPGYSYCAGVWHAYSGRANAALRQLNAARRCARWGGRAARRMALLCLAHHAPHALHDSFLAAPLHSETRLLALKTAEKLLGEVPPLDRKSLQAMLQLATKQKPQAEKVLQEILPLATEDNYQDDPYLILAIANAYNIIKQPTRAKNILKRTISSIPWSPEKADGLEKCWLEVADGQINSGRLDAAKELLTKVLNHNNSCAAAYQYLGYLAEKEQNYKSAAHNYNNAWTHGGKSDLAVGYKLAHAYLKLKKYPECIVVCRHILKVHPDYPKIKKEILEKAKTNLRT